MVTIKDKNLFYIGGIVRDQLINKKSFDIDLTYIGNAIEFVETLDNVEVIQTNKDFGTVRVKIKEKIIDIASTRSEIYPQKGHLPQIKKIGCTLKEDVLRRDFTINSLARSTTTGEIIDYTGGLDDIKNKILRVLHPNSFIDDPTRILRGLKFKIRFGFEMDSETERLAQDYLKNINYDMSYKRLKKELVETFNLNSWKGYKEFVDKGIYKLLSPQDFQLPQYDFSEIIKKVNPKDIWLIYIGLLPDITKLPLTKRESKILNDYKILKNLKLKNDYEIYKALNNLEDETIIMYGSDNPEIVWHYYNDLSKICVKITGKDLQNLGVTPSKKYQECFEYILQKKIKTPNITKEKELNIAKKFFNI